MSKGRGTGNSPGSKAALDLDAGKRRGKGRPKGVPNRATAAAKEAIARFVDGNAERLQQWLDEIYETDGPKAAFDCVVDLIEYHVPKLARTEHTGKDGDAIETVVRWQSENS
jgi:hypothetical protein